ncbi:MAG: hypothetical protein ABEJ66_01720, partial [Candidatus Nanohaloarchaea archaeon]
SLIAASLETIDRVGPTEADIEVRDIEDERTSKRDYIKKRAKQLLDDLNSKSPDHGRITEEVKQEVRKAGVQDWKGFDAGPEASNSEEIVLVEGRADVVNLLRHGVKNAVAIGGTDVPPGLFKLLKEEEAVDHVARAPEEKEVEELGKEKVYEALRDSEPVKYVEERQVERDRPTELDSLRGKLEELVGTRAAHLLDEDLETVERVPADSLEDADGSCYAVLLDGEVDSGKVEKAEELGADYILGMSRSGRATSSDLELFTREELAEVEA